MARGDDIKKILNLAKDMWNSTMGYYIQMIQEVLFYVLGTIRLSWVLWDI